MVFNPVQTPQPFRGNLLGNYCQLCDSVSLLNYKRMTGKFDLGEYISLKVNKLQARQVKTGQNGVNRSKWVQGIQTGPNGAKQVQLGENG